MPNLKKFIQKGIVEGKNALLEYNKANNLSFYIDANGYLVMKYKLLYKNNKWLSREGKIKFLEGKFWREVTMVA